MKIELKPGQNVYITSDTHYNHKNLVSSITEWENVRPGETRDFKSLSHMNQTIVNNINSIVGEDDILIHLGDFSFGGIESIWEFRKQIICKNIYLIFGNHDEHIITDKVLPNVHESAYKEGLLIDGPNPNYYGDERDRMFDITTQQLFTWCGHYAEFEIIYPQVKKDQKKPRYKFVTMHFPIASWNEMRKGRVHFFGHLHSSENNKIQQGRAMDCGLDGNDFKPYELKQAFNLVKDRPIANTILKEDHHS